MKILSFNIRCCDDADGHSIAERAPRLKAIFDECRPDIAGFQECTPEWLSHIENFFGEHYIILNKYRSLSFPESGPILLRKDKFSLLDSGYFWLSDTPWVESECYDALYHCKRICCWVSIKETATNKELFYFNTHFGFGDSEQVKSTELIIKTAELLKAERFIITGDFNCEIGSPAYNKLTEKYSDANMLTSRDLSPTFHGYGKASQHIDYCFISAATVKAASSRLLTDTFNGKYPSDHYGLLTELSII